MMLIKHPVLGECEMSIEHGEISSVDSFFTEGFSVTLDRPLTDTELEILTRDYSAELQEESWAGGHSRNHN